MNARFVNVSACSCRKRSSPRRLPLLRLCDCFAASINVVTLSTRSFKLSHLKRNETHVSANSQVVRNRDLRLLAR